MSSAATRVYAVVRTSGYLRSTLILFTDEETRNNARYELANLDGTFDDDTYSQFKEYYGSKLVGIIWNVPEAWINGDYLMKFVGEFLIGSPDAVYPMKCQFDKWACFDRSTVLEIRFN